MRPEPKEILALAQEIVKAEETLAALRLKWDSYFPETSLPASSPQPAKAHSVKPKGRQRDPESTQGAILNRMEAEPQRTFTTEFFATELGVDRAKVANTLARLAYKGKIHSRARGVYSVDPGVQVAA